MYTKENGCTRYVAHTLILSIFSERSEDKRGIDFFLDFSLRLAGAIAYEGRDADRLLFISLCFYAGHWCW